MYKRLLENGIVIDRNPKWNSDTVGWEQTKHEVK